MCYSANFNLYIKVYVYSFKVKGYVYAMLQSHEHQPGVMIVPITIGSRNSVTILGSGKCAGFVMVICDPPYCFTFFSPNILAAKEMVDK